MPAPPLESEVAIETAVGSRRRPFVAALLIEWTSYDRVGRSPHDHARGGRTSQGGSGFLPFGPLDPAPPGLRRDGFPHLSRGNAPDEGHRFEAAGIPVVMDDHAFRRLQGAVLELDPDPAGEGYRLDHPDAVLTTFC